MIVNNKFVKLSTTNQLTIRLLAGDPTETDLTSLIPSTIRSLSTFNNNLYVLANDGVYFVDGTTNAVSKIRNISPGLGLQDGSTFHAF